MPHKLSRISGLRVVDLGVGLPSALVVKTLGELGATITTVAPAAGDPFATMYPAYRHWKAKCDVVPREKLEESLQTADICIVGGESHPDLGRSPSATDLSERYPNSVVLDLGGDLDDLGEGLPAVDLLAQARSGLVFEQHESGPYVFSFLPGLYGAALAGLCGTFAALIARSRCGMGQVVRTDLLRGLSVFFPAMWMSCDPPNQTFDVYPPRGAKQLIFQCADGTFIQFVLGIPGAVAKLYEALGIEVRVDPEDRGEPRPGKGARNYFADYDLLAPYVAKFPRDELLFRLRETGLGAEPVLRPSECWDDNQVRWSRLIETSNSESYVGLPITLRANAYETSERVIDLPHRVWTADDASPLSGVRVVDFGNFVAGPLAGRILSDLGADVVTVSPPVDIPSITSPRSKMVVQRGKLSVGINLKSAEGLKAAYALCANADVVMHNFRVGVAHRLGIDPNALQSRNPSLITLQSSAYGQQGPKATDTGFDMVMQALCGLEWRSAGAGNAPEWPRSPLVDYATGMLGAFACLAALYERGESGKGMEAEVDLMRTSAFMLADVVRARDGSITEGPVLNRTQTGFHPTERIYRTRDGWLAVAARGETMAVRLATALNLGALRVPASAWSTHEETVISSAYAKLTTEQAVGLMLEHDVWCAPCAEGGWASLAQDQLARRTGVVIEFDDADYGKVTGFFGAPVHLGRWSSLKRTSQPPPRRGSATDQVLAAIGYSPNEIAALRAAKAVH